MASVDQIRTWPSAQRESSQSAHNCPQVLQVSPTSSSCDKPRAIRRDVTTVYLKVFLLSAMSKPDGTNVVHDNCRRVLTSGAYLFSYIAVGTYDGKVGVNFASMIWTEIRIRRSNYG